MDHAFGSKGLNRISCLHPPLIFFRACRKAKEQLEGTHKALFHPQNACVFSWGDLIARAENIVEMSLVIHSERFACSGPLLRLSALLAQSSLSHLAVCVLSYQIGIEIPFS